jgi:hypothetical protein
MRSFFGVAVVMFVVEASASAAAPRAVLEVRHKEFLAVTCGKCHASDAPEANFRVDDLPLAIDTVAAAERWQKVLGALNSGEMPPADEPQPERAAKADFLDVLATTMVVARKSLADQGGRIAMRRLNRREYANTLRDLLGVEVDVSDLPADTSPLAFDTVGASLFMTASQFEQYEAIGRDALAAAFKKHAAAGIKKQMRTEAEKTLGGFKQANEKFQANQQAAREWFKQLDAAVASPENADFVAKTRPTLKKEEEFKFHWRSLKGLPSPDDAVANSGNNPQFLTVILEEQRFIPYEEHYLAMPGLDTGAYLSVPAGGRAPNSNSRLNFDIPPDWPPGEYVIRVRCGARPEAEDDRRFIEFAHRHYGDRMPAISAHHVTGTLDAPQVIEIPYTLKDAGSDPAKRRFMIREIGTGSAVAVRKTFDEGVKANGIGPELAIWVDWIEIERKPHADGGVAPGIKALAPLLDAKDPDAVPPAQAKRAVEQFIAEAYRGAKPGAGEVDRLAAIYATRRGLGAKHEQALIEAVVSVLSSPRFLYRCIEPADAAGNLDQFDLAARLSYFLTQAPPDATLVDLATRNRLGESWVLRREAARLMPKKPTDPMIRSFVGQWLDTKSLPGIMPDPKFNFDDEATALARQETETFFTEILTKNLPMQTFIDPDFTFSSIAFVQRNYGFTPPAAKEAKQPLSQAELSKFQRLAIDRGGRYGGLLGQAAILMATANGVDTQPVIRGAWVLENILGMPSPPPPKNVPALTPDTQGAKTPRDLLAAHTQESSCAICHARIDPVGFALENYDPVGRWRAKWPGSDAPIDASGTLPDGTVVNNPVEFKAWVVANIDLFSSCVAEKLLTYATGRVPNYAEQREIEKLVRANREAGKGFQDLVLDLIDSRTFRAR